jgi:hypothetical protein
MTRDRVASQAQAPGEVGRKAPAAAREEAADARCREREREAREGRREEAHAWRARRAPRRRREQAERDEEHAEASRREERARLGPHAVEVERRPPEVGERGAEREPGDEARPVVPFGVAPSVEEDGDPERPREAEELERRAAHVPIASGARAAPGSRPRTASVWPTWSTDQKR